MNHCVVPSNWDLEHNNSAPPKFPVCAVPSKSSNSLPSHVPSLDYEVAELTWENGQIAMHGLGPPRVVNKSAAGAGTLESIVSQATCHPQQKPTASSAGGGAGENSYEMVSCFEKCRAMVNPTAACSPCIPGTMDALVPCQGNYDRNREIIQENSVPPVLTGTGTCMVGSCSGAVAARRGMCGCRKNASVSESATCGGRGSRQVTVDTAAGEREYLGGAGFTSTSLWSPENTSSGGGDYAKTSGDDLDHSVCHSRSQREAAGGDVGKRKLLGIEKSSVSTKRSRAAAVHNQSERKRRDKINQKMKTLQKLVPNCSKTDKASMLDEVIEYLKQLQAQVQMVNRMNMPPALSMMLPLALQQQLQMSLMGMGMGMGTHVMDINSIGGAATGLPPIIPPPAATGMPPATAFMPMNSSWDHVPTDRLSSPMVMPNDILSAALMACQSQQQQQQPAITMDAFSRLAALYQQFQQPPAPGYGSNN